MTALRNRSHGPVTFAAVGGCVKSPETIGPHEQNGKAVTLCAFPPHNQDKRVGSQGTVFDCARYIYELLISILLLCCNVVRHFAVLRPCKEAPSPVSRLLFRAVEPSPPFSPLSDSEFGPCQARTSIAQSVTPGIEPSQILRINFEESKMPTLRFHGYASEEALAFFGLAHFGRYVLSAIAPS